MMQVIPAIDLIGGKAVRLTKGDYSKKRVYADDPLDVAKAFADAGFDRLHLVDLDGSKSGTVQHLKVLESIVAATDLNIDFGGGIRSRDDVANVLSAGAVFCTVGSIAARHPDVFQDWIEEFGPEKFFAGADVLDGTVRVSGWTEDSRLSAHEFLDTVHALGVNNFFCTDISKDGAMRGPAVQLYENIRSAFPGISLYASGGVATMADIVTLDDTGCKGVIVGKAIYEGLISLKELAQFNSKC